MPAVVKLPTTPFADQEPGTSGLRKKVTVFQQPNYLANFVQATFNVLRAQPGGVPEVLVVGGDGRFYGREACQIIIRLAAANGVRRVWVGRDSLLSTPAVSAVVRGREGGFVAKGAFILTASHNPGGPTEDFGIKYNGANGGPAPEALTKLIFAETKALREIATCDAISPVDLSVVATHVIDESFTVEVIDSTADYVALLQDVFDFPKLRAFLQRPDFRFVVDAMHGVAGPYAHKVFVELLGAPEAALLNAAPKEDFGGGHPDPNLTYAPELVRLMGLKADGSINADVDPASVPDFGAAFDGDADRNMVLGSRFFVTPSDSVAILAANSRAIPFFARHGGVKSVARSMPTSGALDRVAAKLGIGLAEVPTGWKFFGNLMDSKAVFGGAEYNPLICGEESFGTGSNHVREKDGLWAVLAWLSVLAERNADAAAPLVSVAAVVEEHWATYGRNYYCRYDYEGVTLESANAVLAATLATAPADVPALQGGAVACATVDSFTYTDPVDASVSANQGVRVIYADGSRFVLRKSGTGSSGATIRLYIEQYMAPADVARHLAAGTLPATADALRELVDISLRVTSMAARTGRDAPTVIT